MTQIIECVPNYSNGRDPDVLKQILRPLEDEPGIRVLDYEQDEDHNRAVVTVLGDADSLRRGIVDSVRIAAELIDLREHEGGHPRMGATDVVPFIPIREATMDDCVKLARQVGADIGALGIPVFLYEKAAASAARENLARVRKGQFEGMAEKLREPEWKPDFGPAEPHVSAGVTAVGARMPLVAYNINLGTADLKTADSIARKVRHIGGGLRYVKAMGVLLEERGITQVSINMTDYSRTALYQVFEMVRMEARRYGVPVLGSEIVGLAPMAALLDTAAYYLGLEGFDSRQIIETHLLGETDE